MNVWLNEQLGPGIFMSAIGSILVRGSTELVSLWFVEKNIKFIHQPLSIPLSLFSRESFY